MSNLTAEQTERLDNLIQELTAIHGAVDEIIYGGDPSDIRLRQIPTLPPDLILECRHIDQVLRDQNVDSPRLAEFVSDPSPFVIEDLTKQLRNIQHQYGNG